MTGEKGKGKFGYRTSATELESKFIDILSAIEKQKGAWEERTQAFESLFKKTSADLDEALKLKSGGTDMQVFLQMFLYTHTMKYVCKLGQELSLINEQVVKLEQSIDKLNLKFK